MSATILDNPIESLSIGLNSTIRDDDQPSYISSGLSGHISFESTNFSTSITKDSIRIIPNRVTGQKINRANKFIVKKRLQGFLSGYEGNEAKICIISDSDSDNLYYFLPRKKLDKEKISKYNQPLEIDIVEITVQGKEYESYEVRSLCNAEDSFLDDVILTDDLKRKLNDIVNDFQNCNFND